MEAIRSTLFNAQQAHQVMQSIWHAIKPHLVAERRLHIEVRELTRSGEQNRKLHALISEVAKEQTWAGKKWDAEDWKRLLVSAWMRAKNERPVILPALDGNGVEVLYRRTSSLSVSECSELIDYIEAWKAQA